MRRKIFLNIAIVLILGVVICGALSARIVREDMVGNIEKSLATEAGLVRELVGESLISNSSSMDIYINKIKQTTNSRITIVDVLGNVIIDTDKEYSQMDNHSERPEIASALKGETGISIRYSNTLKVDFMYVAQPIIKGNNIIGAVRLSKPLYEIKTLLKGLYLNVFIAVLIGVVAATLLGYKISVDITKPVEEITYATSKIAKGNFDKRINITSKDEIGILADSINGMAAKLNDTIISLQDKNIRLEAIMSSVVNGIIAIDSTERILFINPVAQKLLDISDKEIVGKHLLQVIRNNSIDNYLKTILKDKKFFDTEIAVYGSEEKILKLYANPIRQTDGNDIEGIIITIQDITELRKLEGVRTEFVANVSHELKTPLTSIKGFAETLKAGGIDDKQDAVRFLNIIEAEADRLYRLINDILSLSELEQKKIKTKTSRESIKVEKAIKEILSMLESQRDKKNIELSMNVQEGLRNITGESDKFKQMLINLVDNAIKYTPENGKVWVEAYNMEDDAKGERVV